MKVKFMCDVEVDINNISENFEELINKSFKSFNEETNKDYLYEDKLRYIDCCREYLNDSKNISYENEVNNLIKDAFSYNLEENDEILDKEDFLNTEFMEVCFREGYKKGLSPLNINNPKFDIKEKEIIRKLFVRLITVVMNYEEK